MTLYMDADVLLSTELVVYLSDPRLRQRAPGSPPTEAKSDWRSSRSPRSRTGRRAAAGSGRR